MKIGIYGAEADQAWRRCWAAAQLPRFYSRAGQCLVDALYHRLVLDAEGIPGGAVSPFEDEDRSPGDEGADQGSLF